MCFEKLPNMLLFETHVAFRGRGGEEGACNRPGGLISGQQG